MTDEDSAIEALVAQLESLHDGRLAATKLIAFGERAIPHLRRFLVDGEPDVVFEPRQWAVGILGALGAKDVLLDCLRKPRPLHPVLAFAEEAVAVTAARELKRWRTEDVFETLMDIVSVHLQPGAIEALAAFRRPETLPYLLGALGDGVSRAAAKEALRTYGAGATDALVNAAVDANPSSEEEIATSLQRRVSVLKLLAASSIPHEQWRRLAPLLDDHHPTIVAGFRRRPPSRCTPAPRGLRSAILVEHPDMEKESSLRARRLALGWSLDQIARLLDRDAATVGAWEADDAPERGRRELQRAVRAIERSRLLIQRTR